MRENGTNASDYWRTYIVRTNPTSMGIFYLVMGLLFIYLAITTASEGLFTFPTIILMLMATIDIGVAIRLFLFTRKLKKESQKKRLGHN